MPYQQNATHQKFLSLRKCILLGEFLGHLPCVQIFGLITLPTRHWGWLRFLCILVAGLVNVDKEVSSLKYYGRHTN